MKLYSRGPYGFWEVHTALDGPRLNQSNCEFHSCYTINIYYVHVIYIYIYIFDKNFNNRYFITLEITLIHTVDIEDNKYYLNNIMEKVIPKSKTKFLQNFF